MAGKKQKRQAGTTSLADALNATRSARRRVLALAARLEATERTILAAMASTPAPRPAAPAAAPAPAAKRAVGRPRKVAPAAPAAKRAVGRPRKTVQAAAPAVKRPVGRPRKTPQASPAPRTNAAR
jgi:AT hook motif